MKNDFINWLPKMKDGGTILFHDTNVRSNFGVWKLWEEIKKRIFTLEIKSGHGLGILSLDERTKLAHGAKNKFKSIHEQGPSTERISKQMRNWS